jgi:carbonic anhydrase
MDGRIQRKVSDYLLTTFGVRNVDTVTAAGMVKHLAADTGRTETILGDLDVSVNQHGSRDIAVVAHHDCAGNPTTDTEQRGQVAQAVSQLIRRHPDTEVIGIWVDRNRTIERVRATL